MAYRPKQDASPMPRYNEASASTSKCLARFMSSKLPLYRDQLEEPSHKLEVRDVADADTVACDRHLQRLSNV
jgi:hypothetical protein